ncbi:MAG: cytochrome C oxidase subunit IV family protein [Chloroflexi bacterium]|nr:cytochrome C oxidase subunit IV family protein [Chloroflexota bacterium]
MIQQPDGGSHVQPDAGTYVRIGVVLSTVTMIEVAAFYMPFLRLVLVPLLLGLAAIKFSLVAMYYMHLKFDPRLLAALFAGGLLVAGSLTIALVALFRNL